VANGAPKRAAKKVSPLVDNPDEAAWNPSDSGDVSVPFLIEAATREGIYAYDLETTGLNPRKHRIEGVAIYIPNDKAPDRKPVRAWFPFVDGTMDHATGGEITSVRPAMNQRRTMDQLRELWSIPGIIAIRHNGGFDDGFLFAASGCESPIVVKNLIADSMLADYISDERRKRYGLKIRVEQVFGHKMTTYDEAAGKQGVFAFALKKPLGAYAMDDTTWSFRLWKWAMDSMRKQAPPVEHKGDQWKSPYFDDGLPGVFSDLEKIFWNIEMKVQRVLLEMELQGCLIDWEWLVEVQQRIEKDKLRILEEIQKQAGWAPNLRSPKQVSDFLYAAKEDGGLGLPTKDIEYNDESESYSTADKAIAHFGKKVPVVKLLLDYRSLEVIDRSFCQKLIGIAQDEVRVFARFRQTGTVIGRLCVAAGTPIEVVRDVSKHPAGIPIQDVKSGDLVYTYDDALRLTLRRVKKSWKTGHRNVVRVHWRSKGNKHRGYVDVTPDHPIRLIDGTYVEANKLVAGDRCLALSRSVLSEGYARVYPTHADEIGREHRWVYETINGPVGHRHIHHKDGNKLNNRLDNLEALKPGDHVSEHTKEMWEDPKIRASITAATTDRWEDEAYCVKHHERMKQLWKDGKFVKPSGEDHPQYIRIEKEWLEAELWKHAGHPTLVARAHTINFDRLKRFIRDYGIDAKTIQLLHRSDGKLITREDVARAMEMKNQREALSFLKVNYYKFNALQRHFGLKPVFNHVIERVEALPDPIDVYDLEIEGTHNFIAGEICVHNSSADPVNLMNQPREKNLIRKAFCSRLENEQDPERQDMVFIDADYGQVELRMAAHLAREKNMIEVYTTGSICTKGALGIPCDRFAQWHECKDSLEKKCKWDGPILPGRPKVCPKCTGELEWQQRCRHVDLHQRTAEDVGVKRNPLAKCLDGRTLVRTVTGVRSLASLIPLTGIPGSHEPTAVMLADGRGGYVTSSSAIFRHNRPTKIVVTKRAVVIATEDHRFQVLGDFGSLDPATPGYEHVIGRSLVEAKNLEKGMKLPVAEMGEEGRNQDHAWHARSTPQSVRLNPFTKEIGDGPAGIVLNEDWAYFAGMFHGDGCASGNACVITHGHTDEYEPWRKIVREACDKLGLPTTVTLDKRNTRIGSRIVRRYFAALGLCEEVGKSGTKIMGVPWWVLDGGPRLIWTYLAGLFDTDGTIGKKTSGTASVTMKSPEYAGQIAFLLRELGMPVLVQAGFNKTYERWYYTIHVLGEGLKRFQRYCPMRHPDKQVRLTERNETIKRRCAPSDDEVMLVLDGGERTVYDFQVENSDHLYLQGGLLGHNNLNFGLLYRMGAPKFVTYADLYDDDGLPRTEYAEGLVEKWHEAYPGIDEWHKRVIEELKRNNFIAYTLTKRRRRLDIEWSKPETQFRAGTQAIQFKVSGCVVPTTPILTNAGYVEIKKLVESKTPIFDGVGFTSNYDVFDTGSKDVFKVTLANGRSLTCSADHRFATMSGLVMEWSKLSELTIGDTVGTRDLLAPCGETDHGASVDDAYLIGAIIGDGYYGSSQGFTLAASAKEPGWPESLEASVIASQGDQVSKRMRWGIRKTNRGGLVKDLVVNSSQIRSNLMILGLDCVSKQKKRIPEWVFTATPEIRGAVLAGLFDTDGSVLSYKQKTYTALTIQYSSRVKELVEGAWRLASSLGIECGLRELDVVTSAKVGGQTKQYRLDVVYRGFRAFDRWVRLRHPRKAATLAGALQLIAKRPPRRELPSTYVKAVADIADKAPALASRQGSLSLFDDGRLRRRVQTYIGHARTGNAGEGMIGTILDYIGESGPKEVLTYGWSKVAAIEPIGKSPTYDIEIHGDNHAYVANGLFTHNSCQDLIKIAMAKIFDARNGRIANSPPAESKLWDRFRFMIQVHDELVMEGPRAIQNECMEMVKTNMESVAPNLLVPLVASVRVGRNWDETH
jgi:DNA polymerase I-like protein with 3'-5' exonuclease and polymerase domains